MPTREAGGGCGEGGGGGQFARPNLEAVGAPPTQLWTVNVFHFYFCLFLHVNLGLSEKNIGPNPVSF